MIYMSIKVNIRNRSDGSRSRFFNGILTKRKEQGLKIKALLFFL